MLTAVHPDGSPLHEMAIEHFVSYDFLGVGMLGFADSGLVRATPDVNRIVRLTLVLQNSNTADVPDVGIPASGVVDGNASVVAVHSAGNAISLVLMVPAGPLAGDVDLCSRRHNQKRGQYKSGSYNAMHKSLLQKTARSICCEGYRCRNSPPGTGGVAVPSRDIAEGIL